MTDIDLNPTIELQSGTAIPTLLLDIGLDPVALRLGGSTPNPDILILPATGATGPQGPQGPAGTGVGFDFTQSAPAGSWIINHNLGYYPSVSVQIGGASGIVDITYGSVNQVTLTFATMQSGTAHLI